MEESATHVMPPADDDGHSARPGASPVVRMMCVGVAPLLVALVFAGCSRTTRAPETDRSYLVTVSPIDVGVGSGAIALAIADEHPGASVVATDNSPGALAVAEENRARARLEDRVELVRGELFAGREGPFDLVVSNPPYVKPDEVDSLEPEVARFEPREALVAHGVTEAVAQGALPRLAAGAPLVLETADGEARDVAALLTGLGYQDVRIGEDLAGRERVVDGRAPR